jgi:serpin B
MGMAIAFGDGADFSRAHQPPPRLQVSFVLQKTFMKVDEEGTEAAAVSAVGVSALAMPGRREEPFEMIVDHPFFCAVSEQQTGAILFAGVITNPAE